MKSIPIKEVITEIMSGEWGIDPTKNHGVAVIRTANFLNSGQINFSKIVRREIDEKKVSKKKLFSGDIIIEKSGGSPTQPVGRVVLFTNPDDDTYLCNNCTSVLRPNREIAFPEYLFYVLHHNHKKGKTLRYQNKTTGIINLKLDNYLSSEIPLPPLDDQIRIATLLSKVENLISRRREQLKQLDELLKSVFLEMFGDPVRNEKRWEKKKIIEFACVKIGPFGSLLHVSDYISNGIPLINPSHIVKGEIRPDSSLTITSTMFNELTSYHLSENDIVVARRGEIGRCALVRDSAKLLCGTGSMFIRIESGYVPDFLQFQIFRTSLKDLLLSKSKGVTMQNLNSTTLETLHVIFPPLDLQKQFAAIIHKVENIKSSYQQSLDELKFLYGTLSQKAFKGELDLSLVRLVEEGESLTRITSESSNSESSY